MDPDGYFRLDGRVIRNPHPDRDEMTTAEAMWLDGAMMVRWVEVRLGVWPLYPLRMKMLARARQVYP